MTRPGAAAFLMAACLAVALAQSVYHVPIQVSDSLEPIVIAQRAPSSWQLFTSTIHFSDTTLRPMRYVQARWLIATADRLGLSYTTVFRGAHAALIAGLILVFVWSLRIQSWLDFTAATVPLTVLAGLHTSLGMMREAYPVNHYAEIALSALIVLAIARRRPASWSGPLAIILLAFGLLLIESGILIWLVIVCCARVGLPGISRRTALVATLVVVAYGAGRLQLGIGSPGIGSNGSGYGDTFYSASDLRERFGDRPSTFIAYNIVGGLASLLLSEPRYGVYRTIAITHGAPLNPVLLINMLSSLLVTAVIAWSFTLFRWRTPHEWSDEDRVLMVSLAVIVVNALMTSTYIKDEILSVAGVFYAVAAYIAIRALLQKMTLAQPRLPATVILAALLAVTSTLWAFRAAGAHFQLRQTAFVTRNEWVDILSPAHPSEWPRDTRELTLVRRLKEEALIHRVANTRDLPAWGDVYWVE